jgi:hypothetical protein
LRDALGERKFDRVIVQLAAVPSLYFGNRMLVTSSPNRAWMQSAPARIKMTTPADAAFPERLG